MMLTPNNAQEAGDMKNRASVGVVALSLCFVLTCISSGIAADSGAGGGTTADLKRLSVEWMQAWKDRDRAKLEGILADDFVLILSASPDRPVVRARWLEFALGDYVCESFEYKSQSVRELGDIAIVASIYTQKAAVGSQDRSGEFFLTDVWQRRAGRWQVVARYSARPEGWSASAGAVVPKENR
jgi:ketosteroid isomerase-like protein